MEAAAPTLLKNKRVLIVEDQYLIAADLSRTLTRLGGVVVGPVASSEAAREQLAKSDIDLAFLDINLDEQMVFPLADELERRGIPFVFATGHEATILPDRFKSRLRLTKPFTVEAVIEAVRHLSPGR
ncbi:response regulator [Taklimakanibacter deserti]|uniref:response regulator n=1 Tax=Taklimakanibacter deserti TaxID=2267839 RepID=UPI000E64C5C9